MIIKNEDEFIHSIARLLFFAKSHSDSGSDKMLEIITTGLDNSLDNELSQALQEEMLDMIRRYELFEKMLHIFAGDSNVDSK